MQKWEEEEKYTSCTIFFFVFLFFVSLSLSFCPTLTHISHNQSPLALSFTLAAVSINCSCVDCHYIGQQRSHTYIYTTHAFFVQFGICELRAYRCISRLLFQQREKNIEFVACLCAIHSKVGVACTQTHLRAHIFCSFHLVSILTYLTGVVVVVIVVFYFTSTSKAIIATVLRLLIG